MTPTISSRDSMKAAAAQAAAALVKDGSIVGLGSGSTASLVVNLLGQRVAEGLKIIGIPTSTRTERTARNLGISLATLAEHQQVDITIDGADEVEIGTLNLLKGRGGALLREKIIASASRQLIIVVDEAKLVDHLGAHGPVAVEVVAFGWHATARKLERIGASVALRTTPAGAPLNTDDGHYILDCAFETINDADRLQRQLDDTVGVVEHGLFLGMAPRVLVGNSQGVYTLPSTRP